jgi:hypothetical protein
VGIFGKDFQDHNGKQNKIKITFSS